MTINQTATTTIPNQTATSTNPNQTATSTNLNQTTPSITPTSPLIIKMTRNVVNARPFARRTERLEGLFKEVAAPAHAQHL